jgi:threonine synthase
LVRAWNTGVYALAQTVATTSPSMDIQISSNFERFLFEAAGRDTAFVRAKMQGLRQSRAIELAAALPAYRREFSAHRVAVEEVAECIGSVKAASGYLLDPHSACGVVAARRAQAAGGRTTPHVALATAHAAKFPETMQAITGERPPLPPRLDGLLAAPERLTVLPNDLPAVQRFVEQRGCHAPGANA